MKGLFRAAAKAALAIAALGILPGGCALIPPLLYWHSKTTSGGAATVTDRTIVASGTAWFSGSVGAAVTLPTNPLGNSNPLTAVEPLANVIPLTAVEPLANVIPLTAVEPLTVVEPYRLLSRAVQVDAPTLFIEAIDLATGNVLKRKLGSGDGSFELRYVAPAGAKGVIVQATVVTTKIKWPATGPFGKD